MQVRGTHREKRRRFKSVVVKQKKKQKKVERNIPFNDSLTLSPKKRIKKRSNRGGGGEEWSGKRKGQEEA